MLLEMDEIILEKLHNWLLIQGIDVVRVGDELTMPSPFKERDKIRRGAQRGYVDQKRRLSITIRKGSLAWQCWYSKGKDGKTFGGRSAWALAVRTGLSQRAICEVIGLNYDEDVANAESLMDKTTAIMRSMSRDREAQQRAKRAIWDFGTPFDDPPEKNQDQTKAQQILLPYPTPSSISYLFQDNVLSRIGEQWVISRGLDQALISRYLLAWDHDREEVLLPFWNAEGIMEYYQWYNHETKRYTMPTKLDGRPGRKDVIFGIYQYMQMRESMPLILSEGIWDALTICGCSIVGSSLTDEQIRLIASLQPKKIILGFDNDNAGHYGATPAKSRLMHALPGIKVVIVYPPREQKDWNGVAQDHGHAAAITCFAKRVREAEHDQLAATVRQTIR